MKLYLKVIGGVHVILAFLKNSPAAQTALKMVSALGTGTPPKDQRLLTNTWRKTRQQHKHTCKQRLTLRNSTTIHENIRQNYARTILRVTTIAWT